MNLKHFLIVAIAACLISPAKAEEQKKMMSYYVRTPTPQGEAAKPPVPNTAPRQTLTILNSIKNAPPGEAEPAPQSIQKESAEAAWARYKTLATGKAQEEPKIPDPAPPQNAQAAPPPPVESAGINGLLNQYQTSKAKRSQMNTLRVSPPSAINPASAGQ